MFDIVIIGGGPAGLTAAIYARRNGRKVLVLEKEGFGGQLATAPRVENYPGVGSVEGAVLAERMLTQALELGADTDVAEALSLEKTDGVWRIYTSDDAWIEARAVIFACGARHRPLGVAGEEELLGAGVSYCAVCDGSFYAGAEVAVCGGGDSALQEALLLSDICRHVYLVHRRYSFRADAALQKRAETRENVTVLTPYAVSKLLAENGALSGLVLRHTDSGEERILPVEALFVAVGAEPALGSFCTVLPLDEKGYAVAAENGVLPEAGLFVAGDCRQKTVRQLTTAAADGANAALEACKYLESIND